jgi:integrase
MKTILTDRALKATKPAAPGTRTMLWDAAVPSFGVRVTDKGKLTFIVMRRLNGKLVRRMLGQYPIMTLTAAREAALTAVRDIERGVDPNAKKAAERLEEERRKADSFESVAEEFISRHVAKLRSAAEVEAVIRRELIRRWGSRPVTDISRRDIVRALEEIADSGRLYSAHKVFNYLSKFFGWAIGRGLYGLESSPCAGIKTSELIGRREPRQRVLNDQELAALWRATDGLGYPAEPFVRLLLLTGQRLREVAEMAWSKVDLEKGLWTIPAERMKGDAAHEVALAPEAVAILQSLPRWTGPFVFSTNRRPTPYQRLFKNEAAN